MALVKLKDGCWIAPEDVAEVKVNYDAYTVIVRMKNGIGHCLGLDRLPSSPSIYKYAEELVARINAAMETKNG